ncbi:hypothetical protein J4573_01230 [Actinomadura barringtoniae]|uniref:Uncharacterized protein n=1 Tax=Actinomadura barringtoniae TaxID=1427535 RepID=A0A939T200_9ACTN|nr:hypothetical protein [Actinomadura barringtoniae]MBO2445703.1 hypothetical protein [Actinomadura barringtoniae]
MKKDVRPNPFHVLGLPADADRESIVERGQELSDLAETDADRDLYQWAVGELVHDASARRMHELLEAPGADYRDERWARFGRRYRRNPADLRALREDGTLRAADFDLSAVIGVLLDWSLDPPTVNSVAAVQGVPVSPELGDPPLEVADVLFG